MDYVFEVAMMSDLISRSWMMEQLDGLGDTRLIKRNFVAMVTNAPAVDAVPVVRCRECKHHHDCETHFCDALGMDCPDDSEFFCSYGERKEGADNEP